MEGPKLEGSPWKRLDWQESCPESKRKMFNNLAGLSDKLDVRDRAESQMTSACPKMFRNLDEQVLSGLNHRGQNRKEEGRKRADGLCDGKASWPESRDDGALTPTHFVI